MEQLGLKLSYNVTGGPGCGKTILVGVNVGKSSSRANFITNETLRERLVTNGFKPGDSFGGFTFLLREPTKRLDVYLHVPIKTEGPGQPGLKAFRGFGLGTEIEKIVYSRVRRICGEISTVRFYQITKPMLAHVKRLGHTEEEIAEGLSFAKFEKSIRRRRREQIRRYRGR